MESARVLLVSDDPPTGRLWAQALDQKDLKAMVINSAKEALVYWTRETFDLVIIDIYASQLDEIELCRQIRAEVVNPILLLTYRSTEPQVLKAYQAGVDECIIKPISPPLFLAKVMAWLRRSWTAPAEVLDSLQVSEFRLDPARRHLVRAENEIIKLTKLEFRLLHFLMRHQGEVLKADVIVDRVWGYTGSGDSTLLKNVVYRLRRKIEPDPGQPRYLQTKVGEGYMFRPS